MYKNIVSTVMLSFVLSSCLPAVFAGIGASTTEIAKDRPLEQTFKDIAIATKIKSCFIKSNFKKLYAKIKVEVINGRVLYTGNLSKNEEIIEAVKIAWDQKDVVEVINELKTDSSSDHFDLAQYTRDSMITAQVKSRVFLNKDTKFVNYNVITLNDIVYLFGIARSESELQTVAEMAASVKGVKKVISHAKLLAHQDIAEEGKKNENIEQETVLPKNPNKSMIIDQDLNN